MNFTASSQWIYPVCIAATALGVVVSNILFKLAGQQQQTSWTIAIFVLGLAAGFIVPVCTTIGLKYGNNNLFFAIYGGISYAVLQMTFAWAFRQPVTYWQWGGIALIGLGLIVGQLGGPSAKSGPAAEESPREHQE